MVTSFLLINGEEGFVGIEFNMSKLSIKYTIKNAVLVSFLGCSLLLVGSLSLANEKKASGNPAENRCTECHEDQVTDFKSNIHSKAWLKLEKVDQKKVCETCHGAADEHVTAQTKATIISFTKGSSQAPLDRNKQCLNCHSNQTKALMFWNQGIHNRNDVTCADCHSMHGGRTIVKPMSESCLRCHKDVGNDLKKFSHHPIIEGKVGCADCHNPHGSLSEKNLKADSVNLLCYKCHADKRGPFLNEHPPVAENCLNCHKPHGSQHGRLLTQRVPALCQECHDMGGYAPLAQFGKIAPIPSPAPTSGFYTTNHFFGQGCLNCHYNVHGSNDPTGSSGGQHYHR